MKVLIACEFSGVVRREFALLGHMATSYDLLPTYKKCVLPNENHIQGDITQNTNWDYDLMICHPPCTYLAVSGARWMNEERKILQEKALEFVNFLLSRPIPHICLENPVSVISTRIRKPDQIIQPFQFGHPEKKRTCLWFKRLPQLKYTKVVKPLLESVYYESGNEDQAMFRSVTCKGIAEAMAAQWTPEVLNAIK